MSSSRTPLFVDPNERASFDSNASYIPDEESSLLGGLATTSPSRPFAITFHPTILLRLIALLLALPAFILLITTNRSQHGGPATSSIVFLSFAIARQIQIVLISHFGSQIIVIRVEIVHSRLKHASKAAEVERWIMKLVNAIIDGAILIGLLVSLALVAHWINNWYYADAVAEAAVILGFLSFGAQLLSILDFGSPALVTMAISVERPADGQLKLATSVLYGEAEKRNTEAPKNHVSGDIV